ncbi:hypothetical protein DL771_004113 [Monosporascus sp. 5C6A]|nr:hypothetical protein DL771_004113 [Monosporascus sp. 5C6A]
MQAALSKVVGPKEVHPENLTGRTAIVIGGAHGIGYEISRALAHAGAKVIMVGRKEEQADDAISHIREESPDAEVQWKECDIGNLKEVQSRFSQLRDGLDRLDFLVLSAGINAQPFGLDADGIDRHFGVNYLGHYYATNQLWPLIRKTSNMPGATPPRIVSLSSELHKIASSNLKFASLDEINNEKTDPTHLYGRTKLALLLFTKYGLVDRVIKPNSDAIYALAVHPGTVNTNMQEQWKDAYPGLTGHLISWALKSAGRTPEQGSFSALWALTAPEITEKDQNGYYFSDPGTEGTVSSQAKDPELGKALWELSEKIVKDKLGDDALVDWNAR